MSTLAQFGTGEFVWTLFWFTLFFIWIWLVITVFIDIFRSHDLGGGAKALWVVFVIVLPYLGVFVYLLVRGGSMSIRMSSPVSYSAETRAAQAAFADTE